MPVSVARAPASTRTSQPPPPAAQGDGCASVWARAEDKLCFGSFFCPEPEIWPTLAGHAAAPSLGPPARQLGSTAGGLAALKTGRERPPGARVGSSQPSHGTPRCPRPQGLCCPLRQGERGRGRDQRGALGWVRWGGEGPGLLTFVADVFVALFPPLPVPEVQSHLPPPRLQLRHRSRAGGGLPEAEVAPPLWRPPPPQQSPQAPCSASLLAPSPFVGRFTERGGFSSGLPAGSPRSSGQEGRRLPPHIPGPPPGPALSSRIHSRP